MNKVDTEVTGNQSATLPDYVTQEELKELKAKVNKSMEQLVKLVLKVKRDLQALEERIAIFNQKAGHKL